MTEKRRPTAQNILDGVVQALHQGREPLGDGLALVPSVYVVMLHPEAYTALQVLLPRIREQAVARLDAEMTRVNTRKEGRWARWMGRLLAPLRRLLWAEAAPDAAVPLAYERAGDRWRVDVVVTAEMDAGIDYLGVETDFGVEAPPALKGRATVNIRRRTLMLPDGRFETVLSLPRGDAPGGPATLRTMPPPRPSSDVLARLTYEDNQGRHIYYMRKAEIVLGRSDETAPDLDVPLDTLADVSREHLRLRHDDTGFALCSVGRYGTTVDGERLPDDAAWHPLGPTAEIGLADAVYIDFEAL